MGIVCFPDEMRPRETVVCVFCEKEIPKTKATAGLFDADGNQVFACNEHFWRGHDFIVGWVDYGARIRLQLLTRGELPQTFTMSDSCMEGRHGDWSIC